MLKNRTNTKLSIFSIFNIQTASVLLALTAFAANSVLCRRALGNLEIDAASFTAIRLISGAFFLSLLVGFQYGGFGWVKNVVPSKVDKSFSRLAGPFFLFSYAAAFSFAYLQLDTGTGALILFGSVQLTMVLYAFFTGKALNRIEVLGLLLAFLGLVYLLLPTLNQPSFKGFVLMFFAGVAWGAYTLLGRGSTNATRDTALNFLGSIPFVALLIFVGLTPIFVSVSGLFYAILSGALASGAGYAIWFYCLRNLTIATAATSQLSVPIIAAIGGVIFNEELFTSRLAVAMVLVIVGSALVIHSKRCLVYFVRTKGGS